MRASPLYTNTSIPPNNPTPKQNSSATVHIQHQTGTWIFHVLGLLRVRFPFFYDRVRHTPRRERGLPRRGNHTPPPHSPLTASWASTPVPSVGDIEGCHVGRAGHGRSRPKTRVQNGIASSARGILKPAVDEIESETATTTTMQRYP